MCERFAYRRRWVILRSFSRQAALYPFLELAHPPGKRSSGQQGKPPSRGTFKIPFYEVVFPLWQLSSKLSSPYVCCLAVVCDKWG